MSEEKGIQTTRNPITAIVEPRTNELVQVFMGDAAKAERFKAQAATLAVAAASDPKKSLSNCSPASVWLALKGVAELDLQLTPSLGEAYIVPYGPTATLIVGYKGLKEIAFRSGIVTKIESTLVYEKDEFTYQRGTDPGIRHVPAPFGQRGAITGAYTVANLTNGQVMFEVMSKAEIDAIAEKSKSGAVWKSHYGEMARKTPLRRLAKYLPTTPLLAKALAYDEDAIIANDGTEVVERKRPSLADSIAGRTAEPAPSNAKQLPPADERAPDVEETPEIEDTSDYSEPQQPAPQFKSAKGVKITAEDIPWS